MNIYKQLISGLRIAKVLQKPDFEDFVITASIKIAQTNDNVNKDALIAQLQNSLNQYANAYRTLALQNQSITTELMNLQGGQGGYGGYTVGDGGPTMKPSPNIAGATDIFFDSNDIARTVVQDGSHFNARIEHNENIPLMINT
jgi:hypothetical protein